MSATRAPGGTMDAQHKSRFEIGSFIGALRCVKSLNFMKKGGFRRLSDCRKTFQSKDYGKEDSVKETHQGCLSRSINQFFKLFKV